MSDANTFGPLVATYLREHTDDAIEVAVTEFRTAYPASESLQLSNATLCSWTQRELGVLIAALNGDTPDESGMSFFSGDVEANVSPLVSPFVTRVETWIFLSRTWSTLVWRGFAGDPVRAQQALEALERATLSLMKADAAQFVEKSLVPGALQREWTGPLRTGRIVADRNGGPHAEEHTSRDALTPREAQIVKLVAAGKTNGEIAATLCLKQSTVKNHLSRVFDKANVNTRTELTRWAIDSGIV